VVAVHSDDRPFSFRALKQLSKGLRIDLELVADFLEGEGMAPCKLD
jgi:hypothetical protein